MRAKIAEIFAKLADFAVLIFQSSTIERCSSLHNAADLDEKTQNICKPGAGVLAAAKSSPCKPQIKSAQFFRIGACASATSCGVRSAGPSGTQSRTVHPLACVLVYPLQRCVMVTPFRSACSGVPAPYLGLI